jgi:hypothetical protein
MSLIDVLVGIALVLIVFAGIFGLLRAELQTQGLAKLEAAATTIASSQMEYIRSLEYSAVGTDGGIPAGTIPQTATTTDGGLTYTVRTYVEYADDPADGTGAADSNGITTDYKHVKVTVSYTAGGVAHSVSLVSNVVPSSIETTTGGGTLLANVVDSLGAAISGASVRIVNASTSPDIDFTTFSDTHGTVSLPGAPTSTQYQIYVSKTGYSSAQTYQRTGTNVNPTPGYLTVVGNTTTSSTFAIDRLASLIIRTFSPVSAALFTDLFNDATKLVTVSGTQVVGGALTLAGTPGAYAGSGVALSTTTAPAYLARWSSASSTLAAPLGTAATVSVTDGSGTLLPDAVLPGNSAGFAGVIDLTGLSTTTYPALALKATLSTSDPNATPSIADWHLGYDAGPTPLPNVSFTLTGAKTIGSTSGGASIYKTVVASTTDSSGVRSFSLEWDLYQLAITGYTIATATPADIPLELSPGGAVDESLILQ